VALAAIQGLHQMMQQKDAKLMKQTREISKLKRKLQAIETKLGL
jgi:type II secretory pathway component PulJ